MLTATQRVRNALQGSPVDRIPVLPKIWIAGACQLTGRNPLDLCGDPLAIMQTIIAAARLVQADAARLFLFPSRRIARQGSVVVELDADGNRLGTVDLQGGWATQLDDPARFNIRDAVWMAHNHSYPAHAMSYVNSIDEAEQIAVPTADTWESLGYGALVDQAIAQAPDLCLIGDCDTPTLAFAHTLRGMEQVMFDLVTDPDMLDAIIRKGVAISVERARFWLRHGIKVLRLNDSMANMSVISPNHWRRFIKPAFTDFCRQVHTLDPDALIYCHICGNVLPILEDLKETGLDCIGPMDPLGGFTLRDVRARIGQRPALMGGVNTMTLLNGTPEQITAEAQACIEQNGSSSGFILGSGCVVPPAAPAENLLALAAAGAVAPGVA